MLNNDERIAELKNNQFYAFYMPDAIETFTADGKTYIITPNEGDSRDYGLTLKKRT